MTDLNYNFETKKARGRYNSSNHIYNDLNQAFQIFWGEN